MVDTAKYQIYKNSGAMSRVKDAIEDLIAGYKGTFVAADTWWRHYLAFYPEGWAQGQPNDILGFVFNSTPGSVRLQLIIFAEAYGVQQNKDALRQAWLNYAILHQPPFRPSGMKLNKTNNTIYSVRLLGPYDPDITETAIQKQLKANWETFMSRDYPQLNQHIRHFGS